MLTVFFHKLGGKSGFQGNLFHQFLVVEGDTQFLGDPAAYTAATAAEFAADGDDLLFHRMTS